MDQIEALKEDNKSRDQIMNYYFTTFCCGYLHAGHGAALLAGMTADHLSVIYSTLSSRFNTTPYRAICYTDFSLN